MNLKTDENIELISLGASYLGGKKSWKQTRPLSWKTENLNIQN